MTKILQVHERSGLLSDSPGFQRFLQRFPTARRSCGHWGLLSVHPDAQGTGVASVARSKVGSHDPAVGLPLGLPCSYAN